MSIVKVISKTGKVYFYPSYYKKKGIVPKGEKRISKNGRVYYSHYQRKNNPRIGLKANRRLCFKRDGFTCQLCGRKSSLVAHHIDNVSPHITPDANNRIDNLITLCQRCHMEIHYMTFDRNQMVVELRQSGWMLEDIGHELGVTRQCVHQILKRKLFDIPCSA